MYSLAVAAAVKPGTYVKMVLEVLESVGCYG